MLSNPSFNTPRRGHCCIAAHFFNARSSGNIPFNDAVDTTLSGFTSTSIVGALNELKSGLTTENVFEVSTSTYTVTSTNAYQVLHVTRTSTGTCTITLNTSWISVDGATITIKDTGLNASLYNITINTQSTEQIEGSSSATINADGDSLRLQAFNGNVYIM